MPGPRSRASTVRSKKPIRNSTHSGFSLLEVMVSSFLLAILVASSTQLYMTSGQAVRRGSIRDAVYARIADDLEELRRETWRFVCENGTACTGDAAHADIPVSYKTARQCTSTPCSNGELLQISALTAACTGRTLGAYMANNHTNTMDEKVFPLSGSTTLDWTKNLPSGTEGEKLAPTKGVTIQRTISVNASDQNQIDVSYTTNSGAPAAVTLNASLVPQALSWCP